MKIFKDLFTGDELFTDTFAIEEIKGVVYKVKGKMVTQTDSVDESKFGANASAEGCDGDEGTDPSAVSGVDIVMRSRLQEFAQEKKQYMLHIKEYMKSVKARLEEEKSADVALFTTNVAAFVKGVLGDFKNYQFYCGESMKPEGMLCLLKWEDDGASGEIPMLYFFKHGLEEEKV